MIHFHMEGALIGTERVFIFDYVNWRKEEHTYAAAIESVELGKYNASGQPDPSGKLQWVMHGHVIERDSQPRPGRRTFLISKMSEIVTK